MFRCYISVWDSWRQSAATKEKCRFLWGTGSLIGNLRTIQSQTNDKQTGKTNQQTATHKRLHQRSLEMKSFSVQVSSYVFFDSFPLQLFASDARTPRGHGTGKRNMVDMWEQECFIWVCFRCRLRFTFRCSGEGLCKVCVLCHCLCVLHLLLHLHLLGGSGRALLLPVHLVH